MKKNEQEVEQLCVFNYNMFTDCSIYTVGC